jgi:hypothetical protein
MRKIRDRTVAFFAGLLFGPAIVFAGLETGVYISDLVATNPLSSDLASTADDHIRLLKSTIKTTFPNINNAITVTDEQINAVGASGVTGAANPTGTIGLTAVNGSATTFLRSDGAPALSQSIAPTMSGKWTYSYAGASGSDSAINFSSTFPVVSWVQTNGAADNKTWDLGASSEQLKLRIVNDANSVATNIFVVDRTGTTVDRVSFPTEGAAFSVGTFSHTFNSSRFTVRTATASASAASLINQTAGAASLVVQNEATASDNVFITFVTEAGVGSVRGSIDFNRAATQTRYNITSDERIKKNIRRSGSARALMECLQVLQYDIRETGYHVDHGFTAQSLDRCAPYAVSKGRTAKDMWQVDYSKLVPAIAKYVQEQDARIARLEADAARRH